MLGTLTKVKVTRCKMAAFVNGSMLIECTVNGDTGNCTNVTHLIEYDVTIDGCLLAGNLSNMTGNDSCLPVSGPHEVSPWTILFILLYGLICIIGLVGNGLVIFVVYRYAKMKTVTNMYIINLAISDVLFLFGLPFLITTALMRHWIFGFAMCKVFYVLTSINWFTSVFTLIVMSADRYLAVCHPIKSMQYRTPFVARLVCGCVWSISFLVMLPIMLYATTMKQRNSMKESCTIVWPEGQPIPADKAFIWYAFLLGFAIPVSLISVFYALVLVRLKAVGPKIKTKEKKRTHRKVTKMVLTVIAVYVVCWLPYWIFQVDLTFRTSHLLKWEILLFQVFTLLSYANSMLNPLLYAFLSDNFRKSFIKAFKCATYTEVNGTLHAENSIFPRRTTHTGSDRRKVSRVGSEEEFEIGEMTTMSTRIESDGVNGTKVTTVVPTSESREKLSAGNSV